MTIGRYEAMKRRKPPPVPLAPPQRIASLPSGAPGHSPSTTSPGAFFNHRSLPFWARRSAGARLRAGSPPLASADMAAWALICTGCWLAYAAVAIVGCITSPDVKVPIDIPIEAKIAGVSKDTTPKLEAGRDATSYIVQTGGWGMAGLASIVGVVLGRRGLGYRRSVDALVRGIENHEGTTSVKKYIRSHSSRDVRERVARRVKVMNG